MHAMSGAVPLFALPIAALDLETTGLDVAIARIVQVGVSHMVGGEAAAGARFERLVAPGTAIPAAATAIHGIADADVAAAPRLAAIWPDLIAFLGDRVVVGHTLAYDLTVLEREAARRGLAWQRPRSLCVRKLAPIAIPALHDPSLERLAAWLGFEIERRHSAMGDALAAGRIFQAMVPLLAARGIRTLAEAERAILARAVPEPRNGNAAWVEPVAPPDADAVLAGNHYDTYAYRHLVGNIMTASLLIVPGTASLQEAMRKMAARGASSVLVADPPEGGRPLDSYGILTERDTLREIAGDGGDALARPVGPMAKRPLIGIRAGAYVYRAIARMRRLKVRHLAVTSSVGDVVGMVSARDLLKLRSEPAIALSDAIKEAGSACDLAVAWARLAGVARSLTHEGIEAHIAARIVSEELRSMTERAAILAAHAMERDGLGAAPCPYAVMVLGSGGRGESLLTPDQDNAIVFAEGAPDGFADRWFAELGSRMAAILNQAGIPYCNGDVMAKNPAWRGSVATWRNRIEGWVAAADPDSLLNVDIFFDQIGVHGERRLSQDLFSQAYEAGSRNPVFAKLLGNKLEEIATPLGFLGRLGGADGRIDLKFYVLFPIVSAARTLAIRHNIALHDTRSRLAALARLERGDGDLLAELTGDHARCLALLLRAQSKALLSGHPAGNTIRLRDLDRREYERLRAALKRIQLVPILVRDMMF